MQVTIHEASRLLRGGQLSSVELTGAYLERIRQIEPEVHAFVTVTDDLALEQARKADELIAATSIVNQVPLLTRDKKIRKSRLVPLA